MDHANILKEFNFECHLGTVYGTFEIFLFAYGYYFLFYLIFFHFYSAFKSSSDPEAMGIP